MSLQKKSENELINKRRKKYLIRRTILLMVILVATLITLCLKLPYFNIENIIVTNNKIIKSENIKKESKIVLNTNIFFINSRKIEANLRSNPYIVSVKLKKQLPHTIVIEVTERNAAYYIKNGNKYLIIDKEGYILEDRNDIDTDKLMQVKGLNTENLKNGNSLKLNISNINKLTILKDISDLLSKCNVEFNVSSIDIEKEYDINIQHKNLMIKIGDEQDLRKKFNEAINIISDKKLDNSKGYIDVSFNGNPVYNIQK